MMGPPNWGPRCIPLPPSGRRTIGREAPPQAAAGEDQAELERQLEPYRSYFRQYLDRDLIRTGRLLIEYPPDVIIADRIVEILPTAVVAETRYADQAGTQCVRVPFVKIQRCQQLKTDVWRPRFRPPAPRWLRRPRVRWN
jgi:hypothetical protein